MILSGLPCDGSETKKAVTAIKRNPKDLMNRFDGLGNKKIIINHTKRNASQISSTFWPKHFEKKIPNYPLG